MPSASLQSLGYLPVATATLLPAAVVGCDLYVQRPGSPYAQLWRGNNYPLAAEDLDRLRADGVDHLYIRLEEAEAYRAYVAEHVLRQQDIAIGTRVKALREVTRVAFQDALAANNCDQAVFIAAGFGRNLSNMFSEESPIFEELFTTLEHDFYTFTHVCNVTVYCVVLACRLGICQPAELAELAAGAMLHDIGKRHIPPHVLNKSGHLTDDEWELIREHPANGFRELANRGDVNWPQLMMVYQHHERHDGSGYPAGVVGKEIHPWARVCAVVDVFDALTCQRPYRRALPVSQVCEYLEKHAGVWFDRDAAVCWTAHVRNAL